MNTLRRDLAIADSADETSKEVPKLRNCTCLETHEYMQNDPRIIGDAEQ